MGQVQSVFDPDKKNPSSTPHGYITPPFPSLYNPSLDSTIQQTGYFLHDAESIWRFTFYWTLIFLMGTFMVCATLAAVNLVLSRTIFADHYTQPSSSLESDAYRSGSGSARAAHPHARDPSGTQATVSSDTSSHPLNTPAPGQPPQMPNLSTYRLRKRPPLAYVLFIPLFMAVVAGFVAIVSGTIVGFALAAVYSAAGFSMSTWVPFMWGLIQVVVLIISSYSSLTRVL